jgi:hypothetical protein
MCHRPLRISFDQILARFGVKKARAHRGKNENRTAADSQPDFFGTIGRGDMFVAGFLTRAAAAWLDYFL